MKRFNEWVFSKMGSKGVTLVKLVLWSGLVTWMVSYLAMGIAVAKWFGNNGPFLFGTGIQGIAFSFLTPIWIIFTILLTDVLVARYAYRKMRK